MSETSLFADPIYATTRDGASRSGVAEYQGRLAHFVPVQVTINEPLRSALRRRVDEGQLSADVRFVSDDRVELRVFYHTLPSGADAFADAEVMRALNALVADLSI